MSGGASGVNDPFGNAFMIEVSDLFPQDEIFQQRRTTVSGFERVLVVVDADALIRRQILVARFFPHVFQSLNLLIFAVALRTVFWHGIPLVDLTPVMADGYRLDFFDARDDDDEGVDLFHAHWLSP